MPKFDYKTFEREQIWGFIKIIALVLVVLMLAGIVLLGVDKDKKCYGTAGAKFCEDRGFEYKLYHGEFVSCYEIVDKYVLREHEFWVNWTNVGQKYGSRGDCKYT
jgi:hypothetical protein